MHSFGSEIMVFELWLTVFISLTITYITLTEKQTVSGASQILTHLIFKKLPEIGNNNVPSLEVNITEAYRG